MLDKENYIINKSNYLKLNGSNTLYGGNKGKNIIIHISGPSGAGKTTLGEKIKEKYGELIIVKDIDDLRDDFTNQMYGGEYNWAWDYQDHQEFQSYVDKFVKEQTKPLVFVGLNTLPWTTIGNRVYTDMHSDRHNFYIDIDDMMVVKQKCTRFIVDGLPRIIKSQSMINELINDNDNAVKSIGDLIERACGKKNTLEDIKIWNQDYKKHGYKFMSSDKIFNKVSKILNKSLNISR